MFAYDTLGLMTYEEDGRGSSTRTNYAYDAARRLEYLQPPGHTSGQRYRMEFDSYLGNEWKVTTPIGFVTETIRDTVGRPVRIITPVDSSASVKALRKLTYNAWNCVLTVKDTLNTGSGQPGGIRNSVCGVVISGNVVRG